jgi:D-alanine transaminase
MSRFAYVNGRFQRLAAAKISIQDRGYQFGDGVYEVAPVFNGRIYDLAPHMDRLERSLGELAIDLPMARAALERLMAETIRRNRVREGIVYLQVTRGVAPRDHAFPTPAPKPALVITAKTMAAASRRALAQRGVQVITQPDIRWGRVDIKTVQLLPNALAKQAAVEAGASEVWLIDRDGYVTEGGSTNAWIVRRDGTIVTRPLGNDILGGVMRAKMLHLARAHQLKVIESKFALTAPEPVAEAFFTSTTAPCMPVVRIEDQLVGDGTPGPVTRRLLDLIWADIARETGWRG